jgi:antitoxin component YwqK of YwqJK toxin-antitoxin module
MKEINKYINENGIEISIEKESSEYLPEYLFETYSENGKKIYQNTYKDGELSNVSFYAYSNEEVQTILDKKEGNASITFIYYQNSYKIKEQLAYTDKKLIGNMITVQDRNENHICFKKYELKDSELVCTTTDKSYYENGEEKFAFIYNEDGSCFMIDRVGTYQEDIFAWDIGTSNTDFTWNGFEYYKNVDPLVPEK